MEKDDLVAIGVPVRIREELGWRGNGGRVQRKRLNRWSFKRLAWWIRTKALERGIIAVELNERWTTHRCCLCGSKMWELEGRTLRCPGCGLEIDRDENGATNIALRAMRKGGVLRGLGVGVNRPNCG